MTTNFDKMIENKMKTQSEQYEKIYNKKNIVKSILNPDKWNVVDLEKHIYKFHHKHDMYNTSSSIKKLIEETTGKKIKSIETKFDIHSGCWYYHIAQEYLEITFEN